MVQIRWTIQAFSPGFREKERQMVTNNTSSQFNLYAISKAFAIFFIRRRVWLPA